VLHFYKDANCFVDPDLNFGSESDIEDDSELIGSFFFVRYLGLA
jgi:hypothetical protein